MTTASVVYRISIVVGRTIARLRYGWRVEGELAHIPTGPFILAANHRGVIDPWLVGCVTKRPVSFMAKEELFRWAPVRWWLRAVGSFPVRRGEGDREAIRTALRILENGGIVGIFVEGTRNRDGRPLPVQHGAAMLSVRSGAPIVPAAMVEQGRRRITRVGRPLWPPQGETGPRRAVYAELSNQLGAVLTELQTSPMNAVGASAVQRSLVK